MNARARKNHVKPYKGLNGVFNWKDEDPGESRL